MANEKTVNSLDAEDSLGEPQIKQKEMCARDEKSTIPTTATVTVPEAPRVSAAPNTKTSPNDLYRKLLPAVLFLLTFVTVMTVLLVYMDTVTLGAQQFRLNMSRDYELSRIPQESAALVAYVKQLHLSPRASHTSSVAPEPTRSTKVLEELLGPVNNGTFVEWLPGGARDQSTVYLESTRQWDGVVVRPIARDYLALRGVARALHACLSATRHPREITYYETEGGGSGFSSRVLCLPLYTVLVAADAVRAEYLLIGGENVPLALEQLPYKLVHLQVIEFRSSDPIARNITTELLLSKNYTVAAHFEDSIMYHIES